MQSQHCLNKCIECLAWIIWGKEIGPDLVFAALRPRTAPSCAAFHEAKRSPHNKETTKNITTATSLTFRRRKPLKCNALLTRIYGARVHLTPNKEYRQGEILGMWTLCITCKMCTYTLQDFKFHILCFRFNPSLNAWASLAYVLVKLAPTV